MRTDFKSVKIISNSASGNVNMATIFAQIGETPYLYQELTIDNFYFKIGSSVAGTSEGHASTTSGTMNYDNTTGVFSFTVGHSTNWSSSHGDLVYSWPLVDVYCIY